MSTFRTPRRRARLALAAAITVAAALTGPVSQAAGSPSAPTSPSAAPSPGAPGLGDPVFPLDGNGGYKVNRYLLDFDWQAPRTPFEAATTVKATATQALSRFDLDFAGNTLHTVTVDGATAKAVRDGDELVITPAKPLAKGKPFTVKVTYTADPTQIRHRDDAIEDYGWIPTPDGTVLYPQPNGAKMIFPSNDHPSQRAPITFRITTPPGLTAVANGELTGRAEQADGRVKWTYDSEQPLATQLAQLAIGRFTFVDSTGPHALPIRDVVPDDLVASTEQYRKLTADHIAWLEERLGPYPFNRYGLLVGDTDLGVALETQTLSLIPKADLLGDRVGAERNLVHELTHQWTGDSVGIKTWSDLWLSEGHARFYERLYSQAHGGDSFEATMKTAYASHDQWRHDYGAPAEPTEPNLFKRMRYDGSTLVLYALREKVGQETFGKIERAWVTEYRGKIASTQDYVDLASKVAGQDLDGFLHPWLYGAKTPPMPNHPDWVVNPVQG
ncbi:M1 family metallopeptidase [Streptomyces sp. RLB1-33]|uniref:M1 family metallopeptidase n=1 Tax=Streptomyces mirabilis TaxID=68239 RepID=UPI00143E7B11|nr:MULTISPECIES: M1 family metallopeptidase [Streptomyces]QIY69788.1 M1 family metallopeptidase [Streptomyces sp. RLB1-33]QUW83345.1 M1 family metallopeptidase [Streptomyces mirabilis]